VEDVAESQTDKITTTQFAVDCEVEQREITDSIHVLKVDPDGPDVFRPRRWILTDQLAGCSMPHGMVRFLTQSPTGTMGVRLRYTTSTRVSRTPGAEVASTSSQRLPTGNIFSLRSDKNLQGNVIIGRGRLPTVDKLESLQ
jgi:hypothetical protein